MTRRYYFAAVVSFIAVSLAWSPVTSFGQETQVQQPAKAPPAVQEAEPAATVPAKTQEAEEASLVYEVVAKQGTVRWAKSGVLATASEGWEPVKVGQKLKAGQQVSVAFRGKVKLIARPADPPTVLLFESGSLINIAELAMVGDTAKSRLSLAYGAIRAGVAEGQTRSDMEIAAPVATLSKRGTDIFRFEYVNGRFNMSLTAQGRGLIQAIQHKSGLAGDQRRLRTRNLTPGQYVTHAMARAIDNVRFDRNVTVNDVFGIQGLDQLFTLANDTGIAFLLPGGTTTGEYLQFPGAGIGNVGGIPQTDDGDVVDLLIQPRLSPIRHEGDFGVGQGTIPSIMAAQQKAIRKAMIERLMNVDRASQKRKTLQGSR